MANGQREANRRRILVAEVGGRRVKPLATDHTGGVEIPSSPRMPPREDRCVCKVHDVKAAPVQVAIVFRLSVSSQEDPKTS